MDKTGRTASFIMYDEATLAALDPMAQHAMREAENPVEAYKWPAPRTEVAPPPADMNIDPAKWAALTRAERRGLVQEHKRVKRRGRRG